MLAVALSFHFYGWRHLLGIMDKYFLRVVLWFGKVPENEVNFKNDPFKNFNNVTNACSWSSLENFLNDSDTKRNCWIFSIHVFNWLLYFRSRNLFDNSSASQVSTPVIKFEGSITASGLGEGVTSCIKGWARSQKSNFQMDEIFWTHTYLIEVHVYLRYISIQKCHIFKI